MAVTRQKMYQVDAFTSELFHGNPAAVCLLEEWLPDPLMQAIAAENNLAETAFAVQTGSIYELRWFTPETEVALCGHATLATAHVIYSTKADTTSPIKFKSRERGILEVHKEGSWLVLDFPSEKPETVDEPTGLFEAIGLNPTALYKGLTDYMLIYENEDQIRSLQVDFTKLNRIPARGVIASAPGDTEDFVSRFFAPQSGVPEDPVTGSAHTLLIPYWAKRLGKNKLSARQLSARGGELKCEFHGDRVRIAGQAITYMTADIYLPH
ncbi:PhzF family phenazine biosynthesis protein [Robiginitalea sp. IMCC43444]|uniref:PhzF family phenazine biosynthesis protein n=1 Tax=Robiginitalea sp. IMCC43444 TaxID=3459121 RepID=UPI004042C843